MTWQLTDPTGAPVVRERYWLTFQPGEMRSCTSCHGINTTDQANNPVPVNEPAALHMLLQAWKAQTGKLAGRRTSREPQHPVLRLCRDRTGPKPGLLCRERT